MTDYFAEQLIEIIDTFQPEKRSETLDRFISCVDENTESYLRISPTAAEAFDFALEQHVDYDPRADIQTRMMCLVDEFVLQKLRWKSLH